MPSARQQELRRTLTALEEGGSHSSTTLLLSSPSLALRFHERIHFWCGLEGAVELAPLVFLHRFIETRVKSFELFRRVFVGCVFKFFLNRDDAALRLELELVARTNRSLPERTRRHYERSLAFHGHGHLDRLASSLAAADAVRSA